MQQSPLAGPKKSQAEKVFVLLLLRLTKAEITFLLLILLAAAGVRLPGLLHRAIWYDEAVTLLETAGHAAPSWPSTPVLAGIAKQQFEGAPSLSKIAEDLRRTDIYPPVYYWCLSLWRRAFGFSLESARAFSLLCSLGTILVLYLLLHFGGVEHPLIPTTIYAMSTGAVYFGQEARTYALASLLVTAGALFAYLACGAARQGRRPLIIHSIIMALCCGAALQTHSLALFPVGVILLWFFLNPRTTSWFAAAVPLLIAVFLGSIGLPALLQQLRARPSQLVGFVGIVTEIKTLLQLNLESIWTPYIIPVRLRLTQGIHTGLAVLAGITLTQLFRCWPQVNRKLWVLLLGLASAPSLGIMLLDFVFQKHLHNLRYLLLAAPAFAVILTYGITRLAAFPKYLKLSLLTIILGLQMVTINWGYPQGFRVHPGIDMRSLAEVIRTSSAPSSIVVIGEGDRNESGHPGSVIYELAPATMIVVLSAASDLPRLQQDIQAYDDIWLVFSVDRGTTAIEYAFLDFLQKSGQYQELFHNWPALQLRKRGKVDKNALP
jgi:hypothetical protein